jgi:hypothetical protein
MDFFSSQFSSVQCSKDQLSEVSGHGIVTSGATVKKQISTELISRM